MRAFIAIELPPKIKAYLSNIQNKLKTSGADVRWVNSKNIHLTLKFLGEIEDNLVLQINRVLEDVSLNKNSFIIRLDSLGAFPKINSPRIIWTGIKPENQAVFYQIVEELEDKISVFGIPKENKPFSPHLTIGRIRSSFNREKLVKAMNVFGSEISKEKMEHRVTKLTLFKSTLTTQGPIYTALKEASLKII